MPSYLIRYVYLLFLCFLVHPMDAQDFQQLWEQSHNARLKPDNDSLHLSDARILMQKQTVFYDLQSSGYQGNLNLVCIETYYLQVYISTEKGAHNFNSIKLPLKNNSKLAYIRVRNTKPNEAFIDLDPNEIKFVQLQHLSAREDEINYHFVPVPGVEGGDMIELFAVMISYNQFGSQTVFFHYDMEVGKSIFEFKCHPYINPVLAVYNSHISLNEYRDGNYLSYSFELQDLLSLKNQIGILSEFELPHIKYSIKSIRLQTQFSDYLDQEINPVQWKDFLKKIILDITNMPGLNLPSELRFTHAWFKQFAEKYEGESKLEILEHFQDYVNHELSFSGTNPKLIPVLFSEMISQKQIDRGSLFAFYHAFFRFLGIEHWLLSCKTVDAGKIDSLHVFPEERDELFFGFEMDGKMHFAMPKKTYWYYIDELPARLRGNFAIGMSFKALETNLKIHKIEHLTTDQNNRTRKFKCKVPNLEKPRLNIEAQNISTGDLAVDLRDFYTKMYVSTENKTIFENFFAGDYGHILLNNFEYPGQIADGPKKLTYNYSYTIDNFITKQSNQVYSISIDLISRLDRINFLKVERNFGFYNAMPYKGISRFEIEFDEPVEILNINDLNSVFNNDFGSTGIKAGMDGTNKIWIELSIENAAFYTSPQNFNQVSALLQKNSDLLGKYLLIKSKMN